MPPDDPEWSDSGPSPLSAVGGNGSPQINSRRLATHPPRSVPSRKLIPRFLVIVKSILHEEQRQGLPRVHEPVPTMGRERTIARETRHRPQQRSRASNHSPQRPAPYPPECGVMPGASLFTPWHPPPAR